MTSTPSTTETPTLDTAYAAEVDDSAILVEPPADSRIAQLHAAYAEAKAESDAAAEKLKTIVDGLKAELTQAVPQGTEKVELRGNGPTLRLSYIESWRLDSRKLKADNPETWVRYAKKSGAWQLKAAGL